MSTRPTVPFRCSAAALLCLLAACAGDAPTGLAVDGVSASSSRSGAGPMASAAKPISGRCETQVTPLPSEVPTLFPHTVSAQCQISHLGRTSFFMHQLADFGAGTLSSSDVTFTAANGDVLRATETGLVVPTATGVRFSGTFVFTGGTGRFEHATGTATFAGTANTTTYTGMFTMEGHVSYDASDRGGA